MVLDVIVRIYTVFSGQTDVRGRDGDCKLRPYAMSCAVIVGLNATSLSTKFLL